MSANPHFQRRPLTLPHHSGMCQDQTTEERTYSFLPCFPAGRFFVAFSPNPSSPSPHPYSHQREGNYQLKRL